MRTRYRVLPAPETANVLRQALGPIRAWEDCLADMRRPDERTNVNGYLLFPVGHRNVGKSGRPVYRVDEIVVFINAVRAANPIAKAGIPIQFEWAEIDMADGETWRSRVVTATTLPVSIPIAKTLPRTSPIPPLTLSGV